RAGPDTKWQTRAAGNITDEEVGFIAGDVPGLRSKTAGVCLLQAMRGRVTAGNVQIQHWSCCPHPDSSSATHFKRVSRRACVDFKYNRAGFGIAGCSLIHKRQKTCAAAGRAVRPYLPVVGWEACRSTGVVKLNTVVVFLGSNGVKAKTFAVHAIKTDAGAALNDQI